MQDPYDASDIFGPPTEEDDSETYFYNSLGKPNSKPGARFGAPRDGGSRLHMGGDWGKAIGTPVRPFAPGVVKWVGESKKGGKFIEVDHGNGVVSRYRHLSATGLAVGTPVGYGDTIGESGNTGTSTTGPHVHAEVLVNGKPVDPNSVFGKSLRGTRFEKPEFDAMDIFLGDNTPANPPADGVAVSGATAANPQTGAQGMLGLLDRMQGQAGEVYNRVEPQPGVTYNIEAPRPLEYGGSVEVSDVAPEDAPQWMDAQTAERMAMEAAYYPKSQGFEFGAPPGAAPEEVEQLAIQELAARAGATPEEAVAALRERGVTSFIDVDDPNTELPSIRTQLADPRWAGGPVPVQVGNDWVEAVKEYMTPRAVAGRKAQALTAEAATLPPGSPEALLKYTGARNLLKGVEDNEKMLALQDRETRAYGEAYDELVRDWGYPDDPEAKAQYIKRRRELNRQSVTDGMNIRDMGRDILQDDSLLTLPTRLPLLAAERGSEFIGDVVGSLDTSNGPATPLHEALGRVFRPTTHLEEETADTPGVVGGNIITGFDDALGGWARDETGRSPLDPRDSESDTSRRLDAKPVYGTTQHILGIGERAAGSLAAMDLTMKPLAFLKSKAIAPEEFSGLRLIEKAAKNEIQTGGATTLAGKKAVERTLLSDLGNVAAHPAGDTVGGAATLTSTSILADIAKDVISGRSLEGAATERIKTAPQEFLINMIMLAPGNILGRALAKSGVGLGKLGEMIRMESQGRLNVKDLVREPMSAEFREAWAIAAPVLRGRTAIAAGGIAQTPAQTLTQAIANPDSVFDENGDLRAEDVIVNGVFNTLPAIMHLQERNTTKKGEIFEDLGQAEAGKRTRYRVDVDPLTGKKVTGIGGRAVAVGAEQFRAENLQTARALDKVASLKRKNAPIEDVVAAIDGLPDHIQDSILNEYSVKDADGFTSDAEQYMRMARAGAEMASDPTYLERRAQRVLEDAGTRRNEVDAEVDAELARAEGDFQNSLRTLYEQKNAEVDALETQRIPEDQVEALRAKIPELQTEAEAAQANLPKAQADYQITHDRLAKEFEQAGVTGADPKFIPGYQKKVALLTERANALKEAQANAEAVAQHPDTIKELTKTLQDAEKTNADIDKKIEDLTAKHQDLVVKRGEAYNKAVEAAENRRTTEREAVDKEAQAEATKLLGARDKSIADIEARKASGKPGGTPKLSETPRGEKSEPASGEAAAKAQRDIKNPEQLVSDIIDSDKGKAKRVYSDHILKLAQDARIPDFTKEDADSTATVIANTTSYIGKTLGNRKTTMEDVERLIFKGKTFRQAIKGIPEAPRKVMEDGRVSIPRGQFDPADQISTPRKAVEITIFSGGHADTVLHEFAHAVREGGVLPDADLAVITAWERNLVNQAKDRGSFSEKQLDRYGGELFSHAFERYFTQGEVPEGATPELMGAMNHLRGLFNRILDETGRHLIVSKDQLSPEMRKFFDRFVSDKPDLASLSNPKFLHEGSDEEKFQVAAKGFVDRVFPFLEAMEKAGSRGDNRARSNWIAAENDLYSMYDTLFPDRRKGDFYRDLYGSIDDPAVFDKIRFAESQRHRAENTRRDIEAAIELAQNAAIERRDIAALKQREAEILGIFDKEVDKLVVGENEAAPGVDDNTIKDILDGIEAEYAGAGKVAPQKKPFATKENGRASLLVDGIQHDIPLTEVQQAEWESLERTLNDTLAQDTGDTAENALARKKAIAEYEKGIRDLTGIKSIADLKAEQAEAEKAEADAQKALAEAEKQVASEAAAQAKAEKAKKAEADRIINEAVKDRDARRAREEKEAKAEAERQRKAEEKLQREREKAAAASEKARRAKIATAEKEARVAQATPRKKKITQEEADELKANARSNPAAYVDWNDWKVERYGPRGEYVTMLPPPGHPIRDQWEKAHQDYIAETEALKAAVGRGDLTYERAVAKVNDAQDALFEARNRLGPSAKEWAKARWPELEQPIRMPTEARREAMRAGATAPETVGKWKGGKAPKPGDVRYQDPNEIDPLKAKELLKKAKDTFGITTEVMEAGFVNPDGEMLALFKGGNPFGHTEKLGSVGLGGVNDFIQNTGALRVAPRKYNSGVEVNIEARSPLTEEQADWLAGQFHAGRSITIEFSTGRGIGGKRADVWGRDDNTSINALLGKIRGAERQVFGDREGYRPRFQDPNEVDPLNTPEFKNWFKDSKVVDKETMEPILVHHGTTRGGFSEFKPNINRNEQFGFGIHYTSDPSFAEEYATGSAKRRGKTPQVYSGWLRIENPLDTDQIVREGSKEFDLAKKIAGNRLMTQTIDGVRAAHLGNAINTGPPSRAQKVIKDAGYDGLVYEASLITPHVGGYYKRGGKAKSYVVFEPEQFKSKENRGTFDPADPNIYHQDPNEADPLSDMQDELARIRAQIAQKEQRSTALLNESAKRMDTNFYRAAFREIADMSRAVLLSNPAVHSTNLSSLVINTIANDILAKPVAAAIDRGASLIFGLDPSLTFSYKPELLGAAQMIPKGRGNRDLSKYGGVDEDGNPVRFTKEWREKNLWDLNAWTRAQRVFRGDPLTEEYERVDVNWFDKQNRKEMPKALRIFATPLGVAHAYSKTIYGILGAEDAIAYSGHLAKHIATEAITRAKAEAKDGGPTFKQLYDFYSNDPTLDMVERANMHALIATFNNSNMISKGWRKLLELAEDKNNVLGPPIRAALQFYIPFVQTPSNILFYEGPSWLGLGIPKGAFNMYRAYKGQKGEFKPSAGATPEQIQKEQQKFAENQKMAKFYQQRAAQQGAQGIIGLAVLAGLAQGLNGYFEPMDEHFVPAFDFNDPNQRDEASAMREAGQGYSGGTIRFKFNGEPVTINMSQIGPTGAIAYAAAGIGSHIRRGENEKAIQGAFQQLMYMAGSHPLMQDTPLVFTGNAISDWGDNLSKPEDKQDSNNYYNLTSGVANVTKRLVPPLAFGSLYGDYTDTEDREAKTLSDKMLKMLPWKRSELPVRMSKLNPDETVPKPTLLPRVGGINVDKLLPFGAKPDLAAMDKARATIAETQVLPRKVEPKKDEKPEDFEKRRKEYYAGFRKVLEEVQNDPEYLKLPRHETNDVDHILEDLKDPNFKPVTRRDYLQLRLMGAGLFGGKPKVKRAIVE